MSNSARTRQRRLDTLPPTFTTKAAEHAGLWRSELYRLRGDETVLELSRGVYRKASAPRTAYLDWLAVQQRVPRAVICLESALRYHDLIAETPAAVSFAVPRGSRVPSIGFPSTKVSTFQADTFELGMTTVEAAPGETVRIYDAPRSVVDAMRMPHHVGRAVALHALREYVVRSEGRLASLTGYAHEFRIDGPVRDAIDAVTS